tara:strand:+ start:1304 stop:2533 length:1230 start_codon:yes stop_codon:yes gene_type:complete
MKKINKIAIVWESDTGGGVNSYLRYLLHSKVFLEKEITIFTNFENQGAKPLMKDLAKLKNIKFIFFKSFFDGERKNLLEKIIFYFLNPVFLLLTVFKFKKILSNSNFDVLLCECGNYGIFRSEQAAILASKNLRIPVKSMVIHHACQKPPLFMGAIFRIIDFLLIRNLTSLITVSEATKKTLSHNSNLLESGRLQGHVIHNGVPINNFERKNYLSSRLIKDNPSALKVGMVSRLSPDKGHENLILAFSKLSPEYQKKMIVLIVGENEGNQKNKLKKLVENLGLENRIEFLDYVDIDSKKIILSLDLFLSLTISFEGFGLSIAEAMSVGTPTLATDVGAVTEFFDNECGKLIRFSKIEDIKNSLVDFCDNKKVWDTKAQFAKNKIEKHFNADKMGIDYLNHLNLKFNQNR